MAMTPDEAEPAATSGPARPSFLRRMAFGVGRGARLAIIGVVLALLVLVGLRACQSTAGPPLRPWHTVVPEELGADAIARSDWSAYVTAEERMFAQLQRRVQREMTATDRTPLNRYH